MASNTELDFDELIRNHLVSEASEIKVPSFDSQWSKIKAKLEQQDALTPPRRTFAPLNHRLAWIAILLLAIGALTLTQTKTTEAFGEKLILLFNHIVGKTTVNQTNTYSNPNSSQTRPSVQEQGSNTDKELTLDEAQSIASFKLALPSYLPSGSKLNRVVETNLGADLRLFTIEYTHQGEVIVFTQRNSAKETSSGNLFDTDDTTVKDLMINGNTGTLFTSKNGFGTLDWQMRGLVLELKGKLDPTEMIKIANSIS